MRIARLHARPRGVAAARTATCGAQRHGEISPWPRPGTLGSLHRAPRRGARHRCHPRKAVPSCAQGAARVDAGPWARSVRCVPVLTDSEASTA